jgi:DME family drug/metabolite transporter
MGTIRAATMIFAVGGVISVPVALAHDLSWLATPRGAVSVVHLGVIATALAYLLFTTGIRRVHFGSAITATLVEGVTATVLGTLLVGERLGLFQTTGIALVLVAVWLSGRAKGTATPPGSGQEPQGP